MRQSKEAKAADRRIEAIYYKHCEGVQIDIMDIGKVFRVGREAVAEGSTDEELTKRIVDYVNSIRKN